MCNFGVINYHTSLFMIRLQYIFPKYKNFVLTLLIGLLTCIKSGAFIVVLDAGHGGKDPGALGTYSKEKNIALNVVLRLGKLINENCSDVTVIYTRQTDKFIELDERANIANNAKADLFISVHANASAVSNSVVGSETYSLSLERAAQNLEIVKRENSVIQYEENRQKYNMNSVESSIMNEIIMGSNMRMGALFAKSIQEEYAKVGRKNRGVGQAGFLVLRKTIMPSILTELGFISTPSEEAYLNSEQGINELAMCLFNAFRRHISPILRETVNYTEQIPVTPAHTPESKEVEENKEDKLVESQTTNTSKKQPVTKTQSTQQTNFNPQQLTQKASANTNSGTEVSGHSKTNANPATLTGKYEFKVQICTSDRQLHQNSEQFKGVKDIKSYSVTSSDGKRKFIHTSGNSTSYTEIVAVRNKLRQKFADCFVVVFKDGQRITGEEEALAKKKQP